MRPLTRIAAWAFMILYCGGIVVAAPSLIHRLLLRMPATAPSDTGVFLGVFVSAGLLMVGLFVVGFGVELLRGESWAWWAVVAWLALGVARMPSQVGVALAGANASTPQWSAWSSLAAGVLGVCVLVALLLDPPNRRRHAASAPEPDTGETLGPPTEEEPAP
jgi:hypothetical protein